MHIQYRLYQHGLCNIETGVSTEDSFEVLYQKPTLKQLEQVAQYMYMYSTVQFSPPIK